LVQSAVFDGANGLIGQIFYQLDLPVVKRFDNIAPNRKHSDRGLLTQERNRQGRSSSGLRRHQVTFHLGIESMDRPSLDERTTGSTLEARADGGLEYRKFLG